MKNIFFAFILFASFAIAKPQVIYTGVYSVSNDQSLGNPKDFSKQFFNVLAKWQGLNQLPFDLILETDVEETKHLAMDPIQMAILVTRNDLQIEHFKKIQVTKVIGNLGLSVLFFQTRKTENGTVNTILASIPLNSYIINEKEFSNSSRNSEQAERAVMVNLLAKELIEKRFKQRIAKLSIDEIKVPVTCNDNGCFVENFKRYGLELGQGVSVNLQNGAETFFIQANDGSLDAQGEFLTEMKSRGSLEGLTANLKGYSDNTWQVVNVNITSKKADKLFANEPTRSQLAQWYSDFLSGVGKAVLPPISGTQWTKNALGYTEMILANEDGELSTFAMPPAKNRITLGISGVGSKIAKQNSVHELWLYKLWLTQKVNNGKEVEHEFTTTKKVVVETQEIREVDVFRDLLHVSSKDLAEKE